MRRASLIASSLLLMAGLACQRPEVEAFKQRPRPLVVACVAAPEVPDRQAMEQDYAAALRARLATRAEVVPEGAAAPAEAVTLRLEIQSAEPPRRRSNAAVGVSVGVGVGAMSMAMGNRDWAWDGLFWGLWAHDVAGLQDGLADRLGYAPWEVKTLARLTEPNDPEPLAIFTVDTWDTAPVLSALPMDATGDPVRVREEQAKAFARVVTAKLSEIFGWHEGAARWYGVKALEEPKPLEPRQEVPKVKPREEEPPSPKSEAAPPKPEASPAEPKPDAPKN